MVLGSQTSSSAAVSLDEMSGSHLLDSDWMSIVDLIGTADASLAPYPQIHKDYSVATDAFFDELMELEAMDSSSNRQMEEEVRRTKNAIGQYQTDIGSVLTEYESAKTEEAELLDRILNPPETDLPSDTE